MNEKGEKKGICKVCKLVLENKHRVYCAKHREAGYLKMCTGKWQLRMQQRDEERLAEFNRLTPTEKLAEMTRFAMDYMRGKIR